MASAALAPSAVAVNGASSPSSAEEEVYTQLLRLRDDIVAGRNTTFKLPPAAIERLRASLLEIHTQSPGHQNLSLNGTINNSAFATNQYQLHQPSHNQYSDGLPDLPAATTPGASAPVPSAAGLHPIFLEKSDVVVRAEGQLKRQRLDRDLQVQFDQRKTSSREKEPGLYAPSPIDVVAVLTSALGRVKPLSGLSEANEVGDGSSFDENDYYSSQVQSDWSFDASASVASDRPAGAFTADFERLNDGAMPDAMPSAKHFTQRFPTIPARRQSSESAHLYPDDRDGSYQMGDEDDEYIPPDAAAIDSFREDSRNMAMGQITSLDGDHSDYEPGEVTDSYTFTLQDPATQQPAHVPVIRNHLTHIVAPQPNRVSPLATAKGSSYELELVNGRPEIVQKQQPKQKKLHSRASSASPSGNGMSGLSKKQRKKRRRAVEPTGRSKRRKDRQAATSFSEPHIKDEPISPPPFASFTNDPPYSQNQIQQRPLSIDLSSPRYAPQPQHPEQLSGQGFKYANVQPPSPAFLRVASPSGQQPVQRDSRDLRRVASLHYAQRPPSPQGNLYSPVGPYRAVSATYGEPNARPLDDHGPSAHIMSEQRYDAMADYSHGHSPSLNQEYRQSHADLPPPAAPSRKIIVDQHGNRYYAAEPVAAPESRLYTMSSESMPPPALSHGHKTSYLGSSHNLAPPTSNTRYEGIGNREVPPPARSARQLKSTQSPAWKNVPEQNPGSAAVPRYTEAPNPTNHPSVRGYEQLPLPSQQPPAPAKEQTSFYSPNRSYSVRPEEAVHAKPPSTNYLRHASVAPVQYVRQDVGPPRTRAVSVMPSGEYGIRGTVSGMVQQQHGPQLQPPRAFSQIPAGVRYVDQFGNEVFPREIREVRY